LKARRFHAWIAAATTAALGCGFAAFGQPPAEQRAPEASSQDGTKKDDARGERPADRMARPAVTQFIRKRLAEMKERQAAFETALKRIEAGEDPAKVRDELEPRRNGRRDAGPPRDGPDADGDPEFSRPIGERPGMDRPPPKGGMDKPVPITPEERERALQFLREHMPKVGARVTELAKESPELVDRMLGHWIPKINELRSIRHDSELFELKVREMEGGQKIMWAVRAYRDAVSKKTADIDSRKAELREAFSNQYDTQLEIQKRDADRLAKRIESLREEIQKRQTDRESTIDRQIEDVAAGRPPSGVGPPPRRDEKR